MRLIEGLNKKVRQPQETHSYLKFSLHTPNINLLEIGVSRPKQNYAMIN